MSLGGVIRSGLIVPDHPLALPEGTRVRIEFAETTPAERSGPREGGWWRGKIHIAADFDELPEDIAAAFGMDRA